MRLAVAGLALALAGCAGAEATHMMQKGFVRIDPHPAAQGAQRLTVMSWPEAAEWRSPASLNNPEGRQRLAMELLGPTCRATEEGRTPLTPDPLGFRREQVLLRVDC